MIHAPGFFATALYFLLAIGPLIFVHELGHYLVARWCGVKSEVFSIGFGREVIGWTDKRGTRWKLCWLPLGGYVRFAGDMNAVSQPDAEWKALPEAERRVTFPAQPVWKRFLIVFAGPATNFIAAMLIFMVITANVGELRAPPVIGTIVAGSAAEKAGFRVGDRVVAIDGHDIARFEEIGSYVEIRAKQMMTFTLERAGQEIEILAAPANETMKDPFGNSLKHGRMGMGSTTAKIAPVPLLELPQSAFRQTVASIVRIRDVLGQIVTGKRSVKEMGGPLKTAQYSGLSAALGWLSFAWFVAMVSVNLGFINLLPIPMLDGGHLFFYTIEAVIRRPVPMQAQEWAYRSGFALLMALMLFVTFNDLSSFGLFGRIAG